MQVLEHRPFPLPHTRWVMVQRWHDLLFAHWRCPLTELRRLIPEPLEIDTFDGSAWIGIVPFVMSNTRPRFSPIAMTGFPELNVRTYVRHGDEEGVWFFSLDASNPLAVRAARAAVHLPYYDARMGMKVAPDGSVAYHSERTHRGAPPAVFDATYRPEGEAHRAAPGTLEHFLVERYELFSTSRRGLLHVTIAHPPWPLQRASARIERSTMAAAAGIALTGHPAHLHFAARVDVRTWPPGAV